ncbi:MAG: hypothetical protein MUE68_08550 [Bacteroidetes bacterium]|jgi:hypothetical protein|nr:hypothetical protein [Bacteroidota bacterium]
MDRRSIAASFILLTLVFTGAQAQVSASGLSRAEGMGRSVYGLGLAAGYSSGVGISFRSHLPSKSSVQGIFGIIKTSSTLYMSVGAEYQYDLVRGNQTRFFAVGSTGYFYRGSDRNEVNGPFRVGAGIGAEFNLREAIHLTVAGQFVYASNHTVLPLPQVALHYYFF